MPIVLHCPSCSVRLTLTDDRAGDQLDCPKCDRPIRVPNPSRVAPPTLPPKRPSRQTPTPPARTSSKPDEPLWLDDEPPIPRGSPRQRPDRTWLWIGLGTTFLLLLVAGVAIGLRSRADRQRDRPREQAKGELVVETRPTRSLSETERKIVGTWRQAELLEDGKRVEGQVTYNGNGTFSLTGKSIDIREGTIRFTVSGTWRLQDGLLLSTIEKEEWRHEVNPDFRFEGIVPGGKLVAGASLSERLISVSDTHLVTEDSETKRSCVAERVR